MRTNVPLTVAHHSRRGLDVGRDSPGAADLALNILNHFIPPGFDNLEPLPCIEGEVSHAAWILHRNFKRDFIVPMNPSGGVIEEAIIREWVDQRSKSLSL